MFYKASDPNTSTADWFRLSFDSIPWALLASAAAEGEIEEDVGDEPEEPDADDFEGGEDDPAYLAACEVYEEALAEYEERRDNAGSEPMWSTVFASDDLRIASAREAARACGLRVMEHPDLGWFLAVDSAGHSFYASYWIPLRARGAREQVSGDPERAAALLDVLAEEARREGGDKREKLAGLLGIKVTS